MLSQRETRAFHEAAHAVVAWAAGTRIELKTANETEESLGHCVAAADATRHQLALISRGSAIAKSKYAAFLQELTGHPARSMFERQKGTFGKTLSSIMAAFVIGPE